MSSGALTRSIGDRNAGLDSAVPDEDRGLNKLTSFGIWCLPVLTYTSPGRPSPSSLAFLDGLAVFKLIILLVVFFGGARVILARLNSATLRTLAPLAPFFLFLNYAVISVIWTPRPAITMGQSGGLAALLMLAALVSLVCQDAASVERVLKTLSKSLLAFSFFVLMVHILAPGFSGLDRRMLFVGSDGVVHPTAAGANSSLGLLLAAMCLLIGRYRWAGRMAVAAVVFHGAIAFYASSRTGLAMAVATIPLIVFFYSNNPRRASMIIGAGTLALLLLVFNPGFGLITDSDATSVQYITRGQTSDQLGSFSGRVEMWSKVWNEYTKSPMMGHGYFVTSEEGELEVWYMKANHTAHNIYLQILVSTGALGMVMFMFALGVPFGKFTTLLRRDRQARQIFEMLCFVVIWYLGWSLFCSSFMGPVRSESVFFFTFLGLGVGQLARFSASELPAKRPPGRSVGSLQPSPQGGIV